MPYNFTRSVRLFSALVITAGVWYSCKKDPAPNPSPNNPQVSSMDTITGDTAFPQTYHPTYPGSWWRYMVYSPNTSDTDTVTITLDPFYQQFEYVYADDSTADNTLYRFWAPAVQGQPFLPDRAVLHCEESPGLHRFAFDTLLRLSGGWTQNAAPCAGFQYRQFHIYDVTDSLSTDTVNSIIYNNTYHIFCWNYFPFINSTQYVNDSWYAPNVGLVHRTNYYGAAVTSYMDLVDYYINY